jgi:hypothetical protein
MSYKTKEITFTPNTAQKGTLAFNQSVAYYANYPLGEGNPMPINFSFPENFLYGRIDLEKNVIYPNDQAIKVIPNSNVSALNFVVDAYEEFRSFLKINKFNKLHDDPVIKGEDWKATKGWKGINSFYNEKMTKLVSSFADQYLVATKKEREIKGFEDFIRVFVNDFYLNTMQDMPITKSGFLQSVHAGPHFSGLAIQITNIDASDYAAKFNKFVNSKNFKMFSWSAANFGFMLDYHVPFRLVANLNSSAMISYAKNRVVQANSSGETLADTETSHLHTYSLDSDLNGSTMKTMSVNQGAFSIPNHTHEIVNGVVQSANYQKGTVDNTHNHVLPFLKTDGITQKDIYDIFYVRAINTEVGEFKKTMLGFYNMYSSAYRSFTEPIECVNGVPTTAGSYSSLFDAPKIITKTVSRELVNTDLFQEEYNDLFWHKLYFLIRMKETNASTNEFLVRKALKKIEELYILVDSSAALVYINNYLKQYY